jgi:phosphatidylglycerol---prolipoprotein diacylglyceryl transferase
MLPFFEQPEWHLGPLTIHAFGVTVAAGLWVGLAMAERRFARESLDPAIGHRLGAWMLVAGIVGAHLFSVIFYFPDQLRSDPWLPFRVWEDISSFGGMIGGIVGAFLFFAVRAPQLAARTRLAYLDAIAFVFPFGLAFGRLGCALAHDHPGRVTTFPLSISLKSTAAQAYIQGVYDAAAQALPAGAGTMGFHDLGLYECLFLILIMIPAFSFWDRRRHESGFYFVAFAVLYLPVRSALDSLRISDARYLRLTPGQWVAAVILAALPLVVMDQRKVRFAISGAIILATAWACWGGPR